MNIEEKTAAIVVSIVLLVIAEFISYLIMNEIE